MNCEQPVLQLFFLVRKNNSPVRKNIFLTGKNDEWANEKIPVVVLQMKHGEFRMAMARGRY